MEAGGWEEDVGGVPGSAERHHGGYRRNHGGHSGGIRRLEGGVSGVCQRRFEINKIYNNYPEYVRESFIENICLYNDLY